MAAKTEERPGPRKLEIGTPVDAYGTVYRLRFPATFYPSKDDPAIGWMTDPWGSRKFITLVEAGYDKPLAFGQASRHRYCRGEGDASSRVRN